MGASRGSTHVQSDDAHLGRARDRAVRATARVAGGRDAPRAGSGSRTRVFDGDRDAQWRFAREVSDRLGAVVVALALEHGAVVRFRLYERGRMVDEYLSVPTFFGELPKGDELALEANPTLVARLTGADRDTVRRVTRTAPRPADLPPAEELYERWRG